MHSNKTIRDHVMFRAILQGMSHPGNVLPLPDFAGVASAVAALLGCLMDNAVKFAVIGDPELEAVLVRHTAGLLAPCREADFIIVCNGTSNGSLAHFKRGSLVYPDTGATIVYLVASLSDSGEDVVLSGPGINGTTWLGISGLHPDELNGLKAVNREFPLGVDTIFLDRSGRMACIPRSSRIGAH